MHKNIDLNLDDKQQISYVWGAHAGVGLVIGWVRYVEGYGAE